MKKLLTFVLVICLLICAVQAFAEGSTTYHVDELGLSIAIPSDLLVYTLDGQSDDRLLQLFGTNKEDWEDNMNATGTYLLACDTEFQCAIELKKYESMFTDFDQLSDTVLNVLATSLISGIEEAGATVIDSEICHHEQATYLRFRLINPLYGTDAHVLSYFTTYLGTGVTVNIWSPFGEIDSSTEEMADNIIASICFDSDPAAATEAEQTEAFVYTTPSGVSFTVPDNWVESPMNEERDYLDVKFTSNEEDGLGILYTEEDVWGAMPAWMKGNLPREDFNNTIFTSDNFGEMAEELDLEVTDTSWQMINGREYFAIEGTAQGYGLSVPSTSLWHIENGYMFIFSFNDNPDNPYYGDFEALMNSVVYPDW